MSVPTSPSRSVAQEYRLKVSSYDRVSSMLLAWVILLGIVVLILLIIWWTSQIKLGQAAVGVEMMDLGTGDGPLGGDMKLAGAINEEIELMEPSVNDTLAAIADAVATKAAVLDDPALSDQTGFGRGGGGRGLGLGSGTGSGVARQWEVLFEKGLTLDAYAQQLDYFKIELGVLMPENRVEYANNLSSSNPTTRTGRADQEKRYYLTWRSGQLEEADRELLRRSGIDPGRWLIMKFLTPQLEAELAAKEKRAAGPDADDVRKTRFGVRSRGSGGYEFYVIDQLIE